MKGSTVVEQLNELGMGEKLRPTGLVIVMVVVDDDFRDAFFADREKALSTIEGVELGADDINALSTVSRDKIDELRKHYIAGIEGSGDVIQPKVLGSFVAGMAVGYAAYAYAAKY